MVGTSGALHDGLVGSGAVIMGDGGTAESSSSLEMNAVGIPQRTEKAQNFWKPEVVKHMPMLLLFSGTYFELALPSSDVHSILMLVAVIWHEACRSPSDKHCCMNTCEKRYEAVR